MKLTKERYQELCSNDKLQWYCERDDCQTAHNPQKLTDTLTAMEKNIRNILAEVKKEAAAVKASTDLMNHNYESFKGDVEVLKKKVAELGKRPGDPQVNEHVEELNQYQRRNNILISGIPETTNENVYDIVCSVAAALDVQIGHGDLDAVHRLPSSKPEVPKQILAKIICRWKKEEMMTAKWHKKTLTTTDINLHGPTRNIYLNDHLTKFNESIAKRARDLKREGHIFSTWTRDCKVFVRKTKDGRATAIKKELDLNAFKPNSA